MSSVIPSRVSAVHATVSPRTHPGCVRPDNQDCFLVADLSAPPGQAPWRGGAGTAEAAGAERFVVGPRGLLAVVADGMGGAAAGAAASRMAAAEVHGAMAEPWAPAPGPMPGPFARRLREAVERANAAIHTHAGREPACAGMGTTLTAAGILDDRLVVAQVGDSRAYLVREGRASQLTRDHSLAQTLIDAGILTPVEIESRGLSSVLLRALGAEPKVAVDIHWERLSRGDVLVLCSDGLSRTVSPAEIAAAARHARDPDALSDALMETAIARGAPDNVTVMAITLDGAGVPAPSGEPPAAPNGDARHG